MNLGRRAGLTHIALGTSIAIAITAVAALEARASTPPIQTKVLFENQHVRFVEVTVWPGAKTLVAAEPYPAIVAVDAAWPSVTDQPLDPKRSAQEAFGNRGVTPDGEAYPWCQAHSALGPHEVSVKGNFPQHFYRFEYKRIDGENFANNWKAWYPWILDPAPKVKDLGTTPQSGPPYSKQWPFPIVYDAAHAAPANHYVRYEDDHIQLVEVVVRTGETENMHGHPYSSVYANDGAGPTEERGATDVNKTLVPSHGPIWGKRGEAPAGQHYPDCLAAIPEAPHQVSTKQGPPEHFYRLQFKRLDGDDIKTKWRDWYPPVAQSSTK
jgi:hypothetical protein